jgi:Sulfatase
LMPGIRVTPNYQQHFLSFDGKQRKLLVEGAGGPSWFTEYNVLTGLSVRSYGRFANAVTRVAAGHVDRGLAYALRRCGYRTFSMYPYYGAFVGARRFQTTAGIERFFDGTNLGGFQRTDAQYYDFALRTITWERSDGPMFLFVYTAANHLPWNFRYRPDLMSDWRNLGNRSDVDEYLRRQAMSAQDYRQFVARLRDQFPDEPFIIVRFGDHQPPFAKYFIDPVLDEPAVAKRIQVHDPRYLTTYYAIEAVNFTPADLSSALDTLDAPYLPLVVLEAAGVPLEPSFEEQKKILQRCDGLFYGCKGGAEASRFNRLLIDAGLINGL